MATVSEEANLFELTGEGTEVAYTTTSFTGAALLNYTGPDGQIQQFTGDDQIDAREGPLGTEVTVTLAVVPDLHTITFTPVSYTHLTLPTIYSV